MVRANTQAKSFVAVEDFDLETNPPVSVRKLMDRFDVSRRTVDNWFANGLPRFYMGGRVFTTEKSLIRFARLDAPQVESSQADKDAEQALDAMGV